MRTRFVIPDDARAFWKNVEDARIKATKRSNECYSRVRFCEVTTTPSSRQFCCLNSILNLTILTLLASSVEGVGGGGGEGGGGS